MHLHTNAHARDTAEEKSNQNKKKTENAHALTHTHTRSRTRTWCWCRSTCWTEGARGACVGIRGGRTHWERAHCPHRGAGRRISVGFMNEARLCPIYGNGRRPWRCGGGRADGGAPDQWQRARNGDVGVTSPAPQTTCRTRKSRRRRRRWRRRRLVRWRWRLRRRRRRRSSLAGGLGGWGRRGFRDLSPPDPHQRNPTTRVPTAQPYIIIITRRRFGFHSL